MSKVSRTRHDPNPEQLSILLNIARAMGEIHHIDELIDLLARESIRALGADRCSIFLLDTDSQELWSKVAIGESRRIRFPASQGIAGETLAKGKPIIIDDAYQYKGFNSQIDVQTGYTTKNILSVPMSNAQGKIIGCFEMINKKEGAFSESDTSFLQLLANHAAVAVESALLYEQKENVIRDLKVTKISLEVKMKQLEVVYDLEKVLAETMDFQAFLHSVGTILCRFLRTSAVMVIFQENDEAPVKYLFNENKLSQFDCVAETKGIGLRIKSGFTVDMLQKELDLVISNHLGVPFHAVDMHSDEIKSDIWGRVEVLNHPKGFDDHDLSFLNIVAEKVSSAISRFKLLESREKSQRLATIGQLSSTIVHDFRNPMTSIRGFAELIKISGDSMDAKQRDKLCTIIMNQVDRCTNMIEELLSFARGDKKYSLQVYDSETFIDEIIEILTVETEKTGIGLEKIVDYHGDVYIDKDKMMRVIFNLTNNALDILEKGEKLIIGMTLKGDDIEISVSDTGPGVPKDLQESLFDAFVTQGKATGTGLGLHISKEIVEAHKGSIVLDRSYKKGARFVITLPKYRAEESKSA
ncbi:GAF domain-containing protein [Pseudobacteriovorax antillogorgiicola]|uniref:histidine kinase n=1 Tax=Pseudobacteriovorax antillogorgiicola TaxID=1513793 RepID=A0A1Y6BLX5_9BACT|nr:GAF domain-containing protein [Pseudobacteriovorax antillogorgiicola]TCS56284.1 signal transduction histidine kinase [Pseudobacteriovorax antillogorgiicola]SMF07625.1 Signal transduction histidine kinase [Pseudobacteriovorax antillogorgiicola]